MIRSLILGVILLLNLTGWTQSNDYFQQRVDYTIEVTLNDTDHTLSGFEKFKYTNNSPDNLEFIWVHLWPNAYKNNQTALAKQLYHNGELRFFYSSSEERGFIDSLDFMVDGNTAQWEYHPKHIDICKVHLAEPLKPGESVEISTPFFVKIPVGHFSRLGHIGQSYQVTQWYPKPAVYDKNGWHEMPYLDQGEFYSEYGSFDVSITLPENYVLGATGDLQNVDELMWLEQKALETKNKKYFKKDNSFPPSSDETKTLRYMQNNVHDFAWFADKRYHVLKGQVTLPHSKRKVTTWAMFTNNEAELWLKSIEYLNDATYYYSLWNGDYPYNHVTAVDGSISAGGGMEYPNITVIGESNTDFQLEAVIVHEVGHNWFYGLLGTNERKHPWMDEGLNSLNEARYIYTKYPDLKLFDGVIQLPKNLQERFSLSEFKQKAQYELSYILNASRNYDQPIELEAADYTSLNYGAIVYSKTAVVFDYLKAYLGDELFDRCMQTYYDRWHFKHPGPEDIRQVFEEVTGKDLSWFFKDVIQTTGKIDHKIKKVKPKDDDLFGLMEVKVKNKGDINAPFSVSGLRGDSIVMTTWYDSVPSNNMVPFTDGAYDKVVLNIVGDVPEVNKQNNTMRTTGLLKKVEPLKLQFLASLDDPSKTEIYWFPAVGWNYYDKVMLGLGVHNGIFPRKRLEFVGVPMYSFKKDEAVGTGHVKYHLLKTPTRSFRNIDLKVGYQRFHFSEDDFDWYRLLSYKLSFDLNPRKLNSPHKHKITAAAYSVFDLDFGNYADLIHDWVRRDARWPFQLKTQANYINVPYIPADLTSTWQNSNLVRVSTEAVLNHQYNEEGNIIRVRAFAGAIINGVTPLSRFNFQVDGYGSVSGTGNPDYKYEHVFLGRSETNPNFLSQQFVVADGGLKAPTFRNASNWIGGLNVKGELPLPVTIGVFADFVTYGSGTTDQVYDAGIYIPLFGGNFEWYFPLLVSKNLEQEYEANNISFWQTIRFKVNLNRLNPFELIEQAPY